MKNLPMYKLFFWTMITVIAILPGPNRVVQAGQNPEVKDGKVSLLTLSLAKQIALENNPSLVSALERINQAIEVVAQARADYFPTLTVSAGVDYNEKTQDAVVGYDENQYTNRLSATQILFNGFYRKYAHLSASTQEQMSRAAQDEAKRLLAWSVAQVFLNVQQTFENIKIAQTDMDFNQKQEIEAIAKENAGTGSYSDVLNFKTKVNSARSSLLGAQQDLNESTHGLAALLGYKDACLPGGMNIAPLMFDELTLAREVELGNDMDMESLLAQRPDLKQAFLAVENAEAGIHMAKAAYFPTISLTGAYGTTSGGYFHDTDEMGASVGASVSFDIFSGGANRSKVRQAKAEKRELQKNLAYDKITATSDIRSSAKNISMALQQETLQQENYHLLEITRDLVEKEYAAGQVSLVRLNEAQNNLVNSMGTLSMARVSLILALEEFDYYSGNNVN